MALQINLDKACTVCLQENNDWTSIFEFCPNDEISIQEKIVKCFRDYEEVKFEYPDKICCICLEDLNAAYRFHNNCEQTSNILLRCTVVDTYPEEHVNKDDSSKEDSNKSQYEESSELEQIDFDYVDDSVIVEEKSVTNLMESVKKPDKKEHVFKRFKSKLSKTNEAPNCYMTKATKNAQSQKNAPKICELCGNTYKYQHALMAHMRRHLNDRPFKCEFCEKKFVSNVELRRHMRVHTGVKPYACNYCERCFSDFGSRIKHERTHTGERPFVCGTCKKSFGYAHVLNVHLRTHTGEKKFKCTNCGRGFTKKAYLSAHMQQHTQSAEIAAKDKEIHNTLNLQQDLLKVSNEPADKSAAKNLKCSTCGTGFTKKASLMLHMEQCNVRNTTIADLKEVENLEESLGDCIAAYIIEEDYAGNGEQLAALDEQLD